MAKEIWKDIPDCEGRYFISNYGRAKGPKKILKPSISNWGYERLRIKTNSGKKISPRVHRLVAQLFLPNPDNKPEVPNTPFGSSTRNSSHQRAILLMRLSKT